MTTEIEKTFFDTFGIPKICCKKYITNCTRYGECEECVNYDKDFSTYPQITDHILLELICVLASNPIRILFESMFSGIKEVELLKNSILFTCIANKDTIKHQVRTLFE